MVPNREVVRGSHDRGVPELPKLVNVPGKCVAKCHTNSFDVESIATRSTHDYSWLFHEPVHELAKRVAHAAIVDYSSSVRARESHQFLENFSALSRCLRCVACQTYATFELGVTQAKFLRYVGLHAGISQAELARATDTAPTLTGRVLETLVERGWVRRKRSPKDRRQYLLELTPSGQRARSWVEKARDDFADQVRAVLDDRDMKDFDRVTRKVLSAFEASSQEA
jgi:DNA-binding MarR family transcriptional regulator